MAEKRIQMECPHCGTSTTMEKEFIGSNYKPTICPTCRKKFTYEEAVQARQQAIEARKQAEEERNRPKTIGCPKCTLPLEYHTGDTQLTCPKCHQTFNPEVLYQILQGTMKNNAPDIAMTGEMDPDQIIWRHPLDMMPLNTRVQAKGGMIAVGMQGMTEVFRVDGSSVLLSDTVLRHDAAAYDGAGEKMTGVEIFYLRSAINARIPWGGNFKVTFDNGVMASIPANGHFVIDRIIDPAAFLRSFGFDSREVRLSRFCCDEKEPPRELAMKVRGHIAPTVLQKAAVLARDEFNFSCMDEMLAHWVDVLTVMQREANAALEEYGISVSNLNSNTPTGVTETVITDTLVRRVLGPISWALDHPVQVVHPDIKEGWVALEMKGSLRVSIVDDGLFRGCLDAIHWRSSSNANIIHEEVARYVADMLQGRFMADIQRIFNELHCDIRSVESFAGSVRRKAMEMLNGEGEFFASRGLRVRDFTVSIVIAGKSEVFRLWEQKETIGSTIGIEGEIDDAKTRGYVHGKENEGKRAGADTAQTVAEIRMNDEIAQAQFEADRAADEREAQRAEQQRQIGYRAWADKQRIQREQEEIEYARRRREEEEKQHGAISQAEHEERMFEIAQRIEQSKLTWREKLDAYARLQRGIAFRDKMDEREVETDAQQREKRMEQALQAEGMRVMGELQHEEALREEELAKQRFARDLELRRQKMAEDAAALEAQFERERAVAAEQEARQKSREEIETLRLMLEYLAKNGEQQVTQESLREARAQAELTWQRERQEAERQAAEKQRQQQISAERELAERAMQLAEKAATMRGEAPIGDEKAAAGANRLQEIINRLKQIQEDIQAGIPRNAPDGNPMNTWFDGMVANAGRRNSNAGYAPNASSYGGRMITCGGCGKSFSADGYMCPYCGWNV